MKMSKRCEYAIRGLLGLAVAERNGASPVALTQLAESENIPAAFLEQILRKLKEGGYISSVRGKEGGYALAQAPEKISIGAVVRFVEGPLAPIRCVSRTAYERCSCPNEQACGLRVLMERVRNSVAGILDGTTLETLLGSVISAGGCDRAHTQKNRELLSTNVVREVAGSLKGSVSEVNRGEV